MDHYPPVEKRVELFTFDMRLVFMEKILLLASHTFSLHFLLSTTRELLFSIRLLKSNNKPLRHPT